MDNEREIDQQAPPVTDLVERSKMVFLREVINEFKRKQQQYDLPAEFAKTKRNRSILVPAVIVVLVAVFSVLLVGVTRYIQRSSRAIQIDIQDFADVNLRDILDEAQRLQNQLEAAERELEQVRQELATRIGQVERARDRNIGLLADQNLSVAERNSRAAALRAQADSEIASLNGEYEPLIAEIEARIAALEAQIAEYDSRQLEQARQQEERLNSERQVFELEIEGIRQQYEEQIARLTASYESEIAQLESHQQEFERTIRQRHAGEIAGLILRFNPQLGDEAVGPLLERPETESAARFGGLSPYSELLESEGLMGPTRYAALVDQYEGIEAILERLQQIPFENSVPAALEQLDQRSRDVASGFDEVRVGLEGVVVERNRTIDEQETQRAEFIYALDEFSQINGDIGYILDPRDPDRVIVYINRIHTVVDGSIGYVFRRDDEYIGTIRFFAGEDGRLIARVEETVEDMQVHAFDRVLIEAE